MPSSMNIGTNTMQMHSSDTNAGVTICLAPSMIAECTSLPCSRCQLMFSMVTVASSTRIPTASARPPSVITLSVCPVSGKQGDRREDRERNRHRDDDGGAPAAQEDQDHHRGQHAAMMPSRATEAIADFTNTD
jgi:hypothetical protein